MYDKVGYHHKRLDTGEIFYVGIGEPKRPYADENRNPHWHHIVDKVGFEIIIIKENFTWEEACEWEISEINRIGRRDLGLGPLVNLTDGGEGVGNLSPESRNSISQKMFGILNHRYGIYGPKVYNSKLSQEDAEKIREIFIPHSKEFGIRALSKKFSVDRKTIKKIVSGKSYKGIDGNIKTYEDKTFGIATSGKFSDDDIKYIRAVYYPHHPEFGSDALAKKYNTNSSRIWKIINYKTHSHIMIEPESQKKPKLSPKNSKFSSEEVQIIRSLSCKDAIIQFGLPRSTYYRIKNRIYYKNVE
jgi:hypothetical protein